MVATRRGVRVSSPSKTNPEQSSDVPATPSRTTRRTTKRAESPTHQALVETGSQLDKTEEGNASSPSVKRCTRASRLHSPELPCTPVDSTHEADVSDVESCCSLVLGSQPLLTRSRGRRRQPRTASQEDEVSEAESCSSAVSASTARRSTRRSTRKKTIPESPAREEAAAESCSSVVSESQRVTRSQRKTTRTRSSAKQLTEDSELSEADLSVVSGTEVANSVTRRAARSRKQTAATPLRLDEASDSAASPSRVTRRTRRGQASGGLDVSEPQSCDSEGFESGPTYSLASRRRKALDSDFEATPCSSRTGSGHSRGGAPASSPGVEDLGIIQEKAAEAAEEEDALLDDSKLETTVIVADADCTLVEEGEDESQKEEIVSLASQDGMEKGVLVISDDSVSTSHSPVFGEESVSRPAVTIEHHHVELETTEKKDEETTEMKTQQETILVSGPLMSGRSVTVTCERTEDITEETEETTEAMETNREHPSQNEEPMDEVAAVETQSREKEDEEKMEVDTLNGDAQQVSESIQVTQSQQQLIITVDLDPEEPPKDITVQKKKTISLLESSEDEEVSEEEEISEEEDSGSMMEEQAGPSHKPTSAGPSMDGLFMIDTRPGHEANEQYYKDRRTEEEEEAVKEVREKQDDDEEEFVDEEGDDDDEDTNILFSVRNPLVKEMSSRIDPGIRMKELGGLYINFDGSKSRPVSNSLPKLKEKTIQDEVMKKSVIGPDFEKKDAVPPYNESKKAEKLKRRVEKAKTTGDAWFNMKAPELTQELKRDLKVLQMRGSLDSKRFYKKNDRDGFPKYFQIGTVVDNPEDFYHSRIPKKERKRTMVEELLADAEFRNKNKKKFQQILAEKAAKGSGRKKNLKFLKKKS